MIRRRLTTKPKTVKFGLPRARDDKDFAIEFGEYLAKDVEAFLVFLNRSGAVAHIKNQDELSDRWRGLQSAVYEFRKRAGRVA